MDRAVVAEGVQGFTREECVFNRRGEFGLRVEAAAVPP